MPRANEVLAAKAYRLPGPTRTLVLDPADRGTWDQTVREFFALELRAEGRWVKVERLGSGKSAAVLYRVSVGDNEVGVFKLFDGTGNAKREQDMLAVLKKAELQHMTPVAERGRVTLDPATGFDGAVLMNTAKGTSIKQLIETIPTTQAKRTERLDQLTAAMQRTAQGLAEMHMRLGAKKGKGDPEMMTEDAKLEDANHSLDKNVRTGSDVAKVRAALGDRDFVRVKDALEQVVLPAFIAAEVPATAYHGDANAGNFIVDGYEPLTGYKDLGVIDVGSMAYSINPRTKKAMKTGAADVARLLGSLETLAPGKLTPDEIADLTTEFNTVYFKEYKVGPDQHQVDRASYAAAEKWYRLEMEFVPLKSGTDPGAKARILQLLGLAVLP